MPHLPLEQEPPNVRDYATSEQFNTSNALDLRLHALASAELDRRWAAHKDVLDERLAVFRRMLQRANTECAAELRPPNQTVGIRPVKAATETGCYWNDNGCGYTCLDRLFGRS